MRDSNSSRMKNERKKRKNSARKTIYTQSNVITHRYWNVRQPIAEPANHSSHIQHADSYVNLISWTWVRISAYLIEGEMCYVA